jgi:amidohydrolase
MIQEIQKVCNQYFEEIKQIRRYLHRNPELSNHEFNTSEYIKSWLKSNSISFKEGFSMTGLVAKIPFNNPSKRTVAVRAELDALPIQELNKTAYTSVNSNVMHACGHDAHMAIILGLAKVLICLKDRLEGTVLLIFQPAEEKPPGGAAIMISEGALNDPCPDIVIAQHVMPELESGKVAFRPGKYMASVDEIKMTIKGKGGHAAMPHQLTDSVLIASHIVVALQQIVSRNIQADIPSVLSFGKITGLGAPNVIPDLVTIEGTFRTMDEIWRQKALQKIQRMSESIAEGMGGKCELTINKGYPALVNDNHITSKAKLFASEILGKENVKNSEIWMASEDFAYYAEKYPSVFYRLGTLKANAQAVPLHNPNFDIEEDALKTGVETMSYLVFRFLSE